MMPQASLRTVLVCSLLLIPVFGAAPEPGLLFYLSGDRGFNADYAAGGDPEPNFLSEVRIIPGGAKGPGFECGHAQLLAYWAPGNIYAQRGTLAFFWRSREPAGKTEFPIFRVGYADHSSWDMIWLRIDYNGHGFDAFVTDASLARVRVSYKFQPFPKPQEWIHLALAWDETRGIRLYVNGVLAAKQDQVAVLDAGLDQFGPHSRIISPYQVQSAYNFVRGGDIDEVRIYDRMLSDANIASLAKGLSAGTVPPLLRDLTQPVWRDEWRLRYGWNRPEDPPPYSPQRELRIRKTEIHDVYDLKRWWWKANDGIRETTWPGVYNRSRLPGRNDYFQLPDWDCYSLSGKSVTFTMPDEPWNHLEIAGAAWGKMYLALQGSEKELFTRPKGQERTFHRLASEVKGQKLRFENVEQETPIGELGAYHIGAGKAPEGIAVLRYSVTTKAQPDNRHLSDLLAFIRGRHSADEQSVVVALPAGAPRNPRKEMPGRMLPLVHILVPCDFRGGAVTKETARFSYTWENMNAGLDGFVLELPALSVRPVHGEFFPLNIRVKDPIWPLREMLDVTISVRPGEPKTLWLDTRDRILPNGRSLYLSVAGAGGDFNAASLEGAGIRLIFKPRREAAREHELDRFTQLRDSYAHMVEEHSNTRRLNLWTRFERDVTDLLRVNPDHTPGIHYWYDATREQPAPEFRQPEPPAGVPLWAFRQVEYLRYLKRFVLWWIDNRQIENGEFGGGLSDDGDLTNWWVGTALMGCEPEKVTESLMREMEAFYEQGLFANGLSSIQTDELHSYEEGIQALAQSMMLEYGSPRHLERAMETSRALERVIGVNSKGHTHIRSSYFSGTVISEEGVWEWSKPSSYLFLHPALLLVDYNGSPRTKKLLLDLADGLVAHRKKDAKGRFTMDTTINFRTDEGRPSGVSRVWHLLWAAWRWTGEKKYLEPLIDEGPAILDDVGANAMDLLGLRNTWGRQAATRHLTWQVTGNRQVLEELYADHIKAAALREYINTEGSLWSDRVAVNHADLQRARLGGVALVRNSIYPGHVVSWRFLPPATEESVAILVRESTPRLVKMTVHNLTAQPVRAVMTGWDVEPGEWEIAQGIDRDGDDAPDTTPEIRTEPFARTAGLTFAFEPRAAATIVLTLKKPGAAYWGRPDLGISRWDVAARGNEVLIKVHSLGAAAAPAAEIALLCGGKEAARAAVPAMTVPSDLQPRVADVQLRAPAGTVLKGCVVEIDPSRKLEEITRGNNSVGL